MADGDNTRSVQILTRDQQLGDALARVARAARWQIVSVTEATSSFIFLDERFLDEQVTGTKAGAPAYALRAGAVVLVSVDVTAATWRLAQDINVEQVVDWPAGASQLATWCDSQRSDPAVSRGGRPAASGRFRGQVVAVTGSRGGCGATLLAAAIANASAALGHATVLVDLDPYSAGFLPACGLPEDQGLQWRDFKSLREPINETRLVERLPQSGGIRLLAGDLTGLIDAAAMGHALAACRDAFDTVVLDAPRYVTLPGTIGVEKAVYLSSTELVSLARLVKQIDGASAAESYVVLRKDLGTVSLPNATRYLDPHRPLVCGRVRGVGGSADFGALLSGARHRRLRNLAAEILASSPAGVNERDG